jgi:beta-glucosidase
LASHNLLRAHGAAVERYRGAGAKGQIGIVVNLEPKEPASDSPADIAAAARSDAYMNRQYLDPLYFGRYPDEMAEIYGADWPSFPEREFALIRQPTDFLGINYYKRGVMKHADRGIPERASYVARRVVSTPSAAGNPIPRASPRSRWVNERCSAGPPTSPRTASPSTTG